MPNETVSPHPSPSDTVKKQAAELVRQRTALGNLPESIQSAAQTLAELAPFLKHAAQGFPSAEARELSHADPVPAPASRRK